MRVCPICGYKNDNADDICIHCDRVLPLTAAPVTDTPPQPVPPGSPSGECPEDVCLPLGLLMGSISITASVVAILGENALDHDNYGYVSGKALFLILWVPFGGLLAAMSGICGVASLMRDPSQRGSALWPVLIGLLALVLGGVALAVFASPS